MTEKPEDENIRFPVEQIYTNGAFVRPQCVATRSGGYVWQWVVTEFIDESFYDGELYWPIEMAETREGLVDREEMLNTLYDR